MKLVSFVSFLILVVTIRAGAQVKKEGNILVFKGYTGNRAPMIQRPYIELPLGAIKTLKTPPSLLKQKPNAYLPGVYIMV